MEPIYWQQKSLDDRRKKDAQRFEKKKHFPIKFIPRCSMAAQYRYKKKRNFSIVTTKFFLAFSTHALSENSIGCEQNGYILEHNGKYEPSAFDSHIYTHIKSTTMPLLCV